MSIPYAIAIDTGGTFTDLIAWTNDGFSVLKVPSTPDDPSRAVVAGLQQLLGRIEGEAPIIYGTTVATNALLERQGATVVLLTTEGFEDVLALARQQRPDIYALHPRPHEPLIPAERRWGVGERVDADGATVRPLEAKAADVLARRVHAAAPDAVAICLLHAYRNPHHEQVLARALEQAGYRGNVAISSDVLPEYREYERTATTAVQAYVAPGIDAHLARLEAGLNADGTLLVMQSNGGALTATEARTQAVRTVLSGPAGGVIGAGALATATQTDSLVTLDMGGTSTDVAHWRGQPTLTTEAKIAGLPVRVPMLDIHTVGAGGGSIARSDAGGALRVGPQSAGADPGPACYGKGGNLPTVTDAHVVLGRIAPQHFLGGNMTLDTEAARQTYEQLGNELDLSAEATALGVLKVANAVMGRAISAMTLERGIDPRQSTLCAFGGAGGLHAVDLADGLDMKRVLIPARAGVLSAWGCLHAQLRRDRSVSLLIPLPDDCEVRALPSVARVLDEMTSTLTEEVRAMGSNTCELQAFADLRYVGQSFEISVPIDGAIDKFHNAHAQRFGHRLNGPVELVTLRMVAMGDRPTPTLTPKAIPSPMTPPVASTMDPVVWDGQHLKTAIYERSNLGPGHEFSGPALVAGYSSTVAIPPDWVARVDGFDNLLIERAE